MCFAVWSTEDADLAATVAEFGGIDILVANAGVLWLGPIESTPLKRWQLCLDVNTTGVCPAVSARSRTCRPAMWCGASASSQLPGPPR